MNVFISSTSFVKQKNFVADEDFYGRNVLLLTPLSLHRELLAVPQKQVLPTSVLRSHDIFVTLS